MRLVFEQRHLYYVVMTTCFSDLIWYFDNWVVVVGGNGVAALFVFVFIHHYLQTKFCLQCIGYFKVCNILSLTFTLDGAD